MVSQERTGGWNVQNATRLDMGQYGLVGELLHGALNPRDTADLRRQNAIHILRRPRAGKELDRGLQEGQARGDDA